MNRWRRQLSRIILFSFALRALVPMGLMLQLPAASAEDAHPSVFTTENAAEPSVTTASEKFVGGSLGFVICPVQNPGINLDVLIDHGQPRDQHAHHHHSGHDTGEDDSSTISVDRGASLCHLWTSSADNNLLAVQLTDADFRIGLQPAFTAAVSIYLANRFPRRLTRGPPQTL